MNKAAHQTSRLSTKGLFLLSQASMNREMTPTLSCGYLCVCKYASGAFLSGLSVGSFWILFNFSSLDSLCVISQSGVYSTYGTTSLKPRRKGSHFI